MAVKKNHTLLLKKLKKQIRLLQSKEKKTKNKLRSLVAKSKKVGRTYKSKLAAKTHLMKTKIANAQSSSYAKAGIKLEKQILRGIKTKGKALVSALAKVEKKYVAKLKKSMAKKSKPKKIRKKTSTKMKNARSSK